VERQAVKPEAGAEEAVVFAFAVADVADDGVAGVFEVAADLVEAAGSRARFEQAVAFEVT
jgi:hypothetical protein